MKKGTLIYHADGMHGSREFMIVGTWNGDHVLAPTGADQEEVLIYTKEEIEEGLTDEWLSMKP